MPQHPGSDSNQPTTPPDREPRLREATRAVVIDPHDHLLLVRYDWPERHIWGLPGGGLDPHETELDGLRRELHEELGLEDVEIGHKVFIREHLFQMGGELGGEFDGQRDHVYWLRIDRFDPQPAIGWEAMAAEHVHAIAWWTLDEIEATRDSVGDHNRVTLFSPRDVAGLVRWLLAHGPPDTPLTVGV